jgi:membrane-anchored mycosin MYCP
MLPGARTVAVIVLAFVAAAQCAPPAFAVAPPPVDDRMLPTRHARHHPRRPSSQGPARHRWTQAPATVQHRRNGVDLQQVWRLTRGPVNGSP